MRVVTVTATVINMTTNLTTPLNCTNLTNAYWELY